MSFSARADRIAPGYVDRVRLIRCIAQSLQQCAMMRWQVRLRREEPRRFRKPERGDRHQDQRENATDDKDDRPAETLGQQQRNGEAADMCYIADRRPVT